VYDWDSGEFHGRIPQVAPEGEADGMTDNVMGNCNQHNVCIGETQQRSAEWKSSLVNRVALLIMEVLFMSPCSAPRLPHRPEIS
jgi:hypothetical protein